MQRFMQIVGLRLDSEKLQLPRSVWHALGVVFDMRSMLSSRLLLVKAKETRVLNALVEMVSISRTIGCDLPTQQKSSGS